MAEVPNDSSPHDWNTFTLDLFCPRCDYNVRMLTGSRCPECGLSLDWPRIVASAEQRIDSPLFEYQWRKTPVRSFFGTLSLCLRPWRLWKGLSIADVPHSVGLALFALAVSVIYLLTTTASSVISIMLMRVMYGRFRAKFLPWLLATIKSVGIWYLKEFGIVVVVALFLWIYLQVFQQTISRYRIRRVQLARIVVFAYVPLLIIKVTRQVCLESYWMGPSIDLNLWNVIFDYSGLALCVLSLAIGLDTYLKVRRGWAVAVAIFVLTFLTCFTLSISLIVGLGMWANPFTDALSSAWPGVSYSMTWLLAL
ncbi:MAG TPA: hypothetical protein VJZ71_18860 [Phycisphaerae bacterium]|nr:hypothetical protein [Phycisphaerae bacterium]